MVIRGVSGSSLSLVLALGAWLPGCTDEPRCGALSACDLRNEDCQRAALRYAVCLRGRDESAELEISLRVEEREEFVSTRVAQAIAEDDATARSLRRGLSLFSLSPSDSDAESEARAQLRRVIATYDSDPPRITVVHDGGPVGAGYLPTLVHELVHALQDAAGELDSSAVPPRYDSQLAESAIIEGEATIFEDETWAAGNGLPFDAGRYQPALRSYRGITASGWSSLGDVFSQLYGRFSYAQGASYLWPLYRDKGPEALAEAHGMLPVSSYAVMALDPTTPERRPNDLGEQAVPRFPELTLSNTVHLGRFAYLAFTRVAVPRELRWSMPDDHALLADTLSVFQAADGAVLAVWRFRFDDPQHVADAQAWLAESELPMRVGADGSDLWLMAAEDTALLDAVPAELAWQAAPAEDTLGSQGRGAARRIACQAHDLSP